MPDESQPSDPPSEIEKTQKIELLQETKRNLNAGKIVFSRFELIRELGSGGMGVVWLAKDMDVEGRVALKFLPGLVRDPVAEHDLRDEVKNARDLVHENIVSVRTLHKDDSSIAVEMEYIDGPNVNSLMRSAPNRFLEVDKAAEIVRGLCLAIDYAWMPPRKLVHRDIKPANLLVTSGGLVKVVDFGIAHTVSETITRLTGQSKSERVVGTLPYMSPQQLKGEVGHFNDVYGIGATIYHILTGTPPFRASDAAVLTQQINSEVPASMTERRKQLVREGRTLNGAVPIPKVWEEVVAACLAKDPAKRPATARQIAERLGLMAPAKKPAKSSLMPVMVSVAFVVAGGAGAYFTHPEWFGAAKPQKSDAPAEVASKTDPAAVAPTTTAQAPALPVPAPKALPAIPDLTSGLSIVPAVPSQPSARKEPEAPAAPVLRQSLYLIATGEPIRVIVSREVDGPVEWEGTIAAGDKHELPLDTTWFVQVKSGKGIAWEIDGQKANPLPSPYSRWLVTVPASLTSRPTVTLPPPPFEKEIGPLLAANQISQAEGEWMRAALAGEKGNVEQTLLKRLFAKDSPITTGQWRARSELKFKPEGAALTAADPAQLARAVDLTLPGGAEARLLRIEAGKYNRGSPADEIGHKTNETLTPVTLTKPFFAGIFEVTQAQYESVMGNSPSYWRRNPTWPVDQVIWSDMMGANGFLAKVNKELATQYGGALVADLPTDDEWEYACRAGTTTAFNNGMKITSAEDDPALGKIAHYHKAEGGPKPVGTFEPNAWGLYDMLGNLQEWTKDGTVRGGSWMTSAAASRSAAFLRLGTDSRSRSNTYGFRLVLRFKEAN